VTDAADGSARPASVPIPRTLDPWLGQPKSYARCAMLLREQTPISRLRGQWREYEGIPLMPTFHPAYLLRSPGEKGKVWEDLKQVMGKLGLPPTKGAAS